jgi:hypothetical protein
VVYHLTRFLSFLALFRFSLLLRDREREREREDVWEGRVLSEGDVGDLYRVVLEEGICILLGWQVILLAMHVIWCYGCRLADSVARKGSRQRCAIFLVPEYL